MVLFFRRNLLPERLNDKIDEMKQVNGTVETRLYNAAIERLNRNFSVEQSKRLASLMIAQSKQESGSKYNSDVFKQLNNAFGYKVYNGSPYQLFDKSIKAVDGGASAHFKTLEDGAREVADWIGRRKADFKTVVTANDYVDAMFKNGYTPMVYKADYVKNVNSFYNAMPNIA